MRCRLPVLGGYWRSHNLPPEPRVNPLLGELSGLFNWDLALQRPFHSSTGPQRIDVPGSRLAAMHHIFRVPKICLLG
jgi:hypothetical protein